MRYSRLLTRGITLFATLTALAVRPVAAQVVHVNVDADGLGLSGYDPVAYFSDGKPLVGSKAITAEYDGATYRFTSAEHRDAFRLDPERYAPQFGGFCAYGVAANYKLRGSPQTWRIVAGKLYLTNDQNMLNRWLANTADYIARAEHNWPELKNKPPR